MTIHVVAPGDSVYSIAARYGVSAERIISDNGLAYPNRLVVGQTLVILKPAVTHTVQEGETIFSISRLYNIPVTRLLQLNPIVSQVGLVYPGETLVIENVGPPPLRDAEVIGYAYPFILRSVLLNTIPYLTYLNLFAYGFTPNGDLIPINDTGLIQTAYSYNVAPVMMLVAMTEEGTFSTELASRLLNDPALQSKVIEAIYQTIRQKGYVGIDVDMEYINASDRDAFTNFIRNLKARLAPSGYSVFVALAPKTSDVQEGLLYAGHDYGALGTIADYLLLMTYEWGYTYGPPMAISPINKVREVIEYGITKIPRNKILLGMSNYGYDWKLPYVRGETAATTIGISEAIDLAAFYNAAIQYDEASQAPYFYYYDEQGSQHVVWFEDARSIDARARLVNEYGLRGMSFWQIMRSAPQSWLVISSLYNIRKVL